MLIFAKKRSKGAYARWKNRVDEKGATPMTLSEDKQKRLPVLWHLTWPAIIEQLLGMMVSFVDTAMVGAMGAASTAAVSVVSSSIWLINGILSGVGVGYSVQVANAVGAQDHPRARRVMRQGALAVAALGILVLAVMELLASFLPSWLGAEPEVYPLAVSYLRFYALGLPFSTVMAVFSAIIRCTGDTRTPLALNSLANVVNVVLNFLLIYPTRQWHGIILPGVGLGVAGAAIASAASLAMAGCLLLRKVFFNKEKPVSLGPEENYRPDGDIIRTALRLGVPYIGERVTINLGQILMTTLVAHVGTVALAANHIATTAEGMCYLPAYGVSFAATALVGQAVGARDREDARAYGRLSGLLGFGMCLATASILFLFASPIAGLFTNEGEVIAETAKVLRIVAFAEPFFAISIVMSGALRGARDVRYPMVVALGCMWGIRAILAPVLIYVFHWGLEAVWFAMALDLTSRGILTALRWRSGRWEKTADLTE